MVCFLGGAHYTEFTDQFLHIFIKTLGDQSLKNCKLPTFLALQWKKDKLFADLVRILRGVYESAVKSFWNLLVSCLDVNWHQGHVRPQC